MTNKRRCSVEGCGAPHDAKGYCHSHYKRWKLHGNPLIVKVGPRGSGWRDRKGYQYHTVNGKSKLEHIAVAEKALGRLLPPGVVIHHVDENKQNNQPNNLVICQDNAYHKYLHMRLNAWKACGNADWRKCPYCHQYDDPANIRGEKSGRFVHRKCSATAQREAKAKRRKNELQISTSGA